MSDLRVAHFFPWKMSMVWTKTRSFSHFCLIWGNLSTHHKKKTAEIL